MAAFTDAEADRLVHNIEQVMQMAMFTAAGSIGRKMVGVGIIVVGHDPDQPSDAKPISVYAHTKIGSEYGLRDSTIVGAMASELATLAMEQKRAEGESDPTTPPV